MISDALFYLRATIGAKELAKRRFRVKAKKSLAAFLTSRARISFPKPRAPRATVIIPVHNRAYHTLECLLSLFSVAGSWLEVLVQDDGSSDETGELLSRFDNIIVSRTSENQGFLRSVNDAVAKAKGRFVIVMNNDSRLVDGSIPEALDYFAAQKNCGLMGVRIIQFNGALQEAGSAIFNDGTSDGYLRFRRADDPRALFIRDVDYCSGVFMIFEKKTFQRFGGFDEIYRPAYYEETDFCMRLQAQGLRCIYYPGIVVEHYEFASRPSGALRELIDRHRHTFFDRWGEALQTGGYLPRTFLGVGEQSARRLQKRPRRLLVIDQALCTDEAVVEAAKGAGTLTVFVPNCPRQKLLQLIRRSRFDHEFAGGRGVHALSSFLNQRKDMFDEMRSSGNAADRLMTRVKAKKYVTAAIRGR